MPELGDYDVHRSTYLYCKQAHGGHDQWLVAAPLDSSLETAYNAGECSRCFCLPDTRRIGCMRAKCKDDPPASAVKRSTRTLGAPDKAPTFGMYVNHEACVRANNGRTFTRGTSHCVCHQDGAVSCNEQTPFSAAIKKR
ncbi:hypothetical protein FBU31_005897 [Coemansia sp. 'formosensis']|nr:hypothetical protein FBU31_005897 [Coemansia sp. 'formosensis']